MTTLLFTHPSFLEHDTGPGHPESPERLRVLLHRLHGADFADLQWREAPPASEEQLRAVHGADHIRRVLQHPPGALDPDTRVSAGSAAAALRAAGAVCAAVDAVLDGNARNAFCAVRPPGHHAKPHQAMGFCLFNNIAIGARHAQTRWGVRRVAIVDFDVHHGNGTQAVFEKDASVFYGSSHQYPWYPGTGGADETGVGNLVNAPLRAGSGSAEFRHVWSHKILPAVERFAPQLLLVSAGFDAHRDDTLADLRLDEADFAWIGSQLSALAGHHTHGRLVAVLEGGYALTALANSTAAFVRALMAD